MPYEIQEGWPWQDSEPFDKRSAWIDLLLLTGRWEKGELRDNEQAASNPGEYLASERQLAGRWGWSRTKVRHFLQLLADAGLTRLSKPDGKSTRIEILHFDRYQLDVDPVERRQRAVQEKTSSIPYQSIVEYLNLRTGSQYKPSTGKTRKLIKARWNEGFTEGDFYKVIDKKCIEWLNSDMEKYLRPVTLFGPKFESYLNQLSFKPSGESKQQRRDDLLRKLYQDALEEERRGSDEGDGVD